MSVGYSPDVHFQAPQPYTNAYLNGSSLSMRCRLLLIGAGGSGGRLHARDAQELMTRLIGTFSSKVSIRLV